MKGIPKDTAYGLSQVFLRADPSINNIIKSTGVNDYTVRTICDRKGMFVQQKTYDALVKEFTRRREEDPKFQAVVERMKNGWAEKSVAEEKEKVQNAAPECDVKNWVEDAVEEACEAEIEDLDGSTAFT